MDILIIIGAIVTILGLGGLALFIKKAARLRGETDDPDAVRAQMQGLVALNLGSVLLAFLGLMMIVLGLLL